MPADLASTLLLILLNSVDTLARLWPYVVGGIVVAALLSWVVQKGHLRVPTCLPKPIIIPLAVMLGVASPLPTVGAVPLVLRLRGRGLAQGPGLAFVLASSLMNPLLFMLTLGSLGAPFALAQLGGVLVLSMGLGLMLDTRRPTAADAHMSTPAPQVPGFRLQFTQSIRHVAFYMLLGVIAGAALQVLLPHLGVLDWLGERGLLSLPFLGWLAAPFYTCGGSAVPLARSLIQAGFSTGTLMAFLVVGPALRGTTLASLSCLLPKRLVVVCLMGLALAGGLLGCIFDFLMRAI